MKAIIFNPLRLKHPLWQSGMLFQYQRNMCLVRSRSLLQREIKKNLWKNVRQLFLGIACQLTSSKNKRAKDNKGPEGLCLIGFFCIRYQLPDFNSFTVTVCISWLVSSKYLQISLTVLRIFKYISM